jgi:hypothetical protein
MLWVDHESYFGPDRRTNAAGLRFFERRKQNCAGDPPPLNVALRNLRLHVLDAHGAGSNKFAERLNATAILADMHQEPDAAFELSSLGQSVARHSGEDLRAIIYTKIDRAHAKLRAA